MTVQDIQLAITDIKKWNKENTYHKRPDTYVGSVEHNSSIVPVFVDDKMKRQLKFLTIIEYVPLNLSYLMKFL